MENNKRSAINNIWFLIKNTCKWDKKVLSYFALFTIVNAVLPFINIFAPKFLIDELMGVNRAEVLITILLFYFILSAVLNYLNSYLEGVHAPRFMHIAFKFGSLIKEKCMSMDFKYTEDPKTLNDRETAEKAAFGSIEVIRKLFSLAGSGIAFLGYITIVLTLSPWVLLYLIFNVQVIYYLTARVKKYEHGKKNDVSELNRKSNYIYDIMHNFAFGKDIRIFNLSQWIVDKFQGVKAEEIKVHKDIKYKYFKVAIVDVFLLLIREGLVYIYLIYRVLHGNLSIGNFVMYSTVIAGFTGWMQNILDDIASINAQSFYINDYRNFLDKDLKTENSDYESIPKADTYEIEFKNVSFKYPNSERNIFKNISFKINKGQRLAIVGINGAGKTTFIKLLTRLYVPTEGEILLDGINISRFDRNEYYKLFSVVFQEIKMFAFSIAENISFMDKSGIDREKVIKSIYKAGMEDKINSLEKGIDTSLLKILDSTGIEFSGGENQKLALARGLYKDGSIVILDEPTAALDAIAEYNIYKDFNNMIGAKTALFISHRLASTRFCDVIAFFEDGEIKEYGTHEELLMKNGKYAEMFNVQASYYKEEFEKGGCRMNKERPLGLKKDFNTAIHFLKLTCGISKTYIPVLIISSVFKALTPFINIIIPKFIIDELTNEKRIRICIALVLIIIALNLIFNLVNRWLDTVLSVKNMEILNGFNLLIGKKIMNIDFEKIEDPEVLDLKEKATYGINNQHVIERMINDIVKIFTQTIIIIGLITVIATLNLYIVLFILFIVIVNCFMHKKAQEVKLGMHNVIIPLNRVIQYFDGIIYDFSVGKDIRLYNISPLIMDKYNEYHDFAVNEFSKKYKIIYKYFGFNKVNLQVQMAIIYAYITYKVYIKAIHIGAFMMYVSSAIKFSTTLSEFSTSFIELRQMCILLEPYMEFQQIKSKNMEGTRETKDIKEFNIEFKNVSFKYPRSKEYTLRNVSITIMDKEKLAVVGLNGAGKTTFIKLLTRLYEPTEGEILLNGVNISEYAYDEYMKLLAVVFQDFKLMAFSIKENIVLKDYQSSKFEDIEKTLKKAGLEKDILKLPKGINTHIYKIFKEDGIEFSGGQSQKLAIARAIYKDSPIVVLDEPTAALDPIAEFEIYSKFKDIAGEKTAIYISHRLSSCKLCDRIAVFSNGKIIQYGTHEELIKDKGSQYERMYMTQAQYYA